MRGAYESGGPKLNRESGGKKIAVAGAAFPIMLPV